MIDEILNLQRWLFEWRYWRGRTPWDTNVTPPEVMEFLADAEPGRALDLGCGTGTNAITLARHGWQVTGVDFAPRAIRAAQSKASQAGLEIDFRVGDVSDLSELCGPYDYALDIGCLQTLSGPAQEGYAAGVVRLVRPAGQYMLYAWLPRSWRGKTRGLSPEQVSELFEPRFQVTRTEMGKDQGAGAAWYWLVRA
jgi:2-polyprenyl-3-methyl-5-hydroxy-6-metoxy-1,4-benzoquinol methylase